MAGGGAGGRGGWRARDWRARDWQTGDWQTGDWQTGRMEFELAQVNIGRLTAPVDSPVLAGFMAALDPVNAAADQAPGFVWRLQTEDGNATAIQAFGWDAAGSAGVILNMSVWTDVEHLGAFVFGEMHRQIMRRRREWFHPMREAYLACWWVPAGHRPGTGEAEERVRYLRRHGPTPHAFNLRVSYPPPGGAGDRKGEQPVRGSGEWLCPA